MDIAKFLDLFLGSIQRFVVMVVKQTPVFWQAKIDPVLPYIRFAAIVFILILIFDSILLLLKLQVFTSGLRKMVKGTTLKLPQKDQIKQAWESILRRADSSNPSEWKVAIIEADKLTDNILQESGYKGETMAERMKSLASFGYQSLDEVWYAHKIRNRIAHEADFELDQRMVQKSMQGYQKFFEELELI